MDRIEIELQKDPKLNKSSDRDWNNSQLNERELLEQKVQEEN